MGEPQTKNRVKLYKDLAMGRTPKHTQPQIDTQNRCNNFFKSENSKKVVNCKKYESRKKSESYPKGCRDTIKLNILNTNAIKSDDIDIHILEKGIIYKMFPKK